MQANRSVTVMDCRLSSSFEAVRKRLLSQSDHARLEKPLAYWVRPKDRRLPLAFLGRTVGDLLETSYEELSSTPGVGQKKIGSLVKLLQRVTVQDPSESPEATESSRAEESRGDRFLECDADFDPSLVSELIWKQWCNVVRQQELEQEKLGRLSPCLQHLPTVVWNTPLSYYMDKTLHQIRNLKTHGEKRVRGVLEVFHAIDRLLRSAPASPHLAIRLEPRFLIAIESWVERQLRSDSVPSSKEFRDHLALPLVRQMRIDVGETLETLVQGRLGLNGSEVAVRDQARQLKVTRTRVYQLLDECSRVMQIRWPEGACKMEQLSDHFRVIGGSSDVANLNFFESVRDLFFSKKDGEEAFSD